MRRFLLFLLTICLLVAGCGLSVDDEPRVISFDEIPQELRPGQLPTPTPVPLTDDDVGGTQIHMIGPFNQLQLVEREIADTPERLLEILLNGTEPEEAAVDITSAVSPRTVRIQNVTFTPSLQLVTVDLAAGSLVAESNEQKLAFAQIVYTLTSLPDVSRVEFVQSDPNDPDKDPVPLAIKTDTRSTLPGYQATRDDFEQVAPRVAGTQPQIVFDNPEELPTVEVDDGIVRVPTTIWKIRQVLLDRNGVEVVGDLTELDPDSVQEVPQLIGIVRQLEVSPDALIASLLSGTQLDDRSLGLRSALPPDAFVNAIDVMSFEITQPNSNGITSTARENIALVDFAPASLPSATDGDERILAVAQIVFTLTGLDDIDSVAFLLDGEPIQMPTDSGLSELFDRSNPMGLIRDDFAFHAPGGYLWQAESLPTFTPEPTPEVTTEPTPTPGG